MSCSLFTVCEHGITILAYGLTTLRLKHGEDIREFPMFELLAQHTAPNPVEAWVDSLHTKEKA